MTSQGLAPISVVQVPRVGGVTLPSGSVLRAILVVARIGLAALVVLMMVAAAAVATGRTEIPLQALAAVRSSGTFPVAPAGPSPAQAVVAAPVLKVGTVMNLPLGGVATAARVHSATVVHDIEVRKAAERAAAAARAAERRAAAQRLAAQRAAAAQEAARQAAAERAAEQAAARRAAVQQAAAEEAAAERAAARRAAARRAAAQQAEAEQAAQQDASSAGVRQVSNSGP